MKYTKYYTRLLPSIQGNKTLKSVFHLIKEEMKERGPWQNIYQTLRTCVMDWKAAYAQHVQGSGFDSQHCINKEEEDDDDDDIVLH